ncbi:MAG: hypothetical protein WD081_04115 [Gammaproteobacteria bacterium]
MRSAASNTPPLVIHLDASWSAPFAATVSQAALSDIIPTLSIDALLERFDLHNPERPFWHRFLTLTQADLSITQPPGLSRGRLPPTQLPPDRLALMLIERHLGEAVANDLIAALETDAGRRIEIEVVTPHEAGDVVHPYSAGAVLADTLRRLEENPAATERCVIRQREEDVPGKWPEDWWVEHQWASYERALKTVHGIRSYLHYRCTMLLKHLDHAEELDTRPFVIDIERHEQRVDPAASSADLETWLLVQVAKIRLAHIGAMDVISKRVGNEAAARLHDLVSCPWRRIAYAYRLYHPLLNICAPRFSFPGSMDAPDPLRDALRTLDDRTLDAVHWALVLELERGDRSSVQHDILRVLLPDFASAFGKDHVRTAALRELALEAAARNYRGLYPDAELQFEQVSPYFTEAHPEFGRLLQYRALAVNIFEPSDEAAEILKNFADWLAAHSPRPAVERLRWQTKLGLMLVDIPGREREGIKVLRFVVDDTDISLPDSALYRVLARIDLADALLDCDGERAEAESVVRAALVLLDDAANETHRFEGERDRCNKLLERIAQASD